MDKHTLELLGKQHDFVQSFYEFHPEAFEGLNDEERKLLQDVYFIDREIDVDSVDEHIREHVEKDPDVATRLNATVEKVADNLQLTDEMKADLLLSES